MARTPIVGGSRDGTEFVCACKGECTCEMFWCGIGDCLHTIRDGYLLWQVYQKVDGAFRAGHITKETAILKDVCPRCDRPMPEGTEICRNCGARMKNPFE